MRVILHGANSGWLILGLLWCVTLRSSAQNRVVQRADVKASAKDGQPYVWFPAGSFQMGCSIEKAESAATPANPPARRASAPTMFSGFNICDDDEKPLHQVTIGKGFWLGQGEVTVEAFTRYARLTGKPMPPNNEIPGRIVNVRPAGPLEGATWEEAAAFCSWAGMRLPTEAEWEYAAAGPHTSSMRDLPGTPEWTADWYARNYYSVAAPTNPRGPKTGEKRVTRGGSDGLNPGGRRLSARRSRMPTTHGNVTFRCAGEL